jgi:hypothetical protein
VSIIRKLLVLVAAIVVIWVAWIWWSRPHRVDMAGYVPADALVYIEANDLPSVLAALTSTDSWRELTSQSGITTDYTRFVRFSRLAALTGIGPADRVVLARAQVAAVVTGFDAVERPNAILKLTPRVALVAETHTSEWRLRSAVEKLVGGFASKSYGVPSVEKKEVDGSHVIIWSDPSGSRRQMVAAVIGSVAIVGNDESAVRACLAVRRGERPSLAGNEQLGLMRERLVAKEALVFGLAPPGSPAKIVEVFAPAFVSDVSPDPHVQSLLASFLPQIVNRIVGGFGWSVQVVDGILEDQFFLELPDDLGGRLAPAFEPSTTEGFDAATFVPDSSYQVSRYTFKDPALAWKGLNAGLSSQVNVVHATSISRALEALLKPYGIDSPREFLAAAGREIVTLRLDHTSDSKVLIVAARDPSALKTQIEKLLGPTTREQVANVELMVSAGSEKKAAAVVEGFAVVGEPDDVRRCLTSRAAGKTMKESGAFQAVGARFFSEPAFVTTATLEEDIARAVVLMIAGRNSRPRPESLVAAAQDAPRRRYSISQTRLSSNGLEKKTRSSFGLLGDVILRVGDFRRDSGESVAQP